MRKRKLKEYVAYYASKDGWEGAMELNAYSRKEAIKQFRQHVKKGYNYRLQSLYMKRRIAA
jgi:hypothetical protein